MSSDSAPSASTERIVQLLANHERQKNDRTRRELAEGLVNAAKVAALKELDRQHETKG